MDDPSIIINKDGTVVIRTDVYLSDHQTPELINITEVANNHTKRLQAAYTKIYTAEKHSVSEKENSILKETLKEIDSENYLVLYNLCQSKI